MAEQEPIWCETDLDSWGGCKVAYNGHFFNVEGYKAIVVLNREQAAKMLPALRAFVAKHAVSDPAPESGNPFSDLPILADPAGETT